MAKIVLNYPGPIGAKYSRALEAFALQQGQSIEDVMEPYLRGIAQQIGVNANDDEADQNASLEIAERRAARITQKRANNGN